MFAERYIPQFVVGDGLIEYRRATAQLIAEINDSHGFMDLDFIFGSRFLPMYLAFVEEKLIVRSVEMMGNEYFEPSDEIISIDGKKPEYFISQMELYVASSNRSTLLRDAARYGAKTKKKEVSVIFSRGGHINDIILQSMDRSQYGDLRAKYLNNHEVFHLINDSTGYLLPAMPIEDKKTLSEIKNKALGCPNLIIDVIHCF